MRNTVSKSNEEKWERNTLAINLQPLHAHTKANIHAYVHIYTWIHIPQRKTNKHQDSKPSNPVNLPSSNGGSHIMKSKIQEMFADTLRGRSLCYAACLLFWVSQKSLTFPFGSSYPFLLNSGQSLGILPQPLWVLLPSTCHQAAAYPTLLLNMAA